MDRVRRIVREIIEEMIVEGGYVFKVDISAIPKKFLESTLKKALVDAKLSQVKTKLVGNFSKPYLGDVDAAVDKDELAKVFKANPDDKADFYAKADKYLKRTKVKDFSINKGLNQIHILTPLVDAKGKIQPGVDKKGNPTGKDGWVQIDLMIGNADFMEKAMQGGNASKYTGAHRNAIISASLAHSIEGDGDELEKYQLNQKVGLQKVKFRWKGKKKEKISVETVETNYDKIMEWLFGVPFSKIDTFEKMWKALHSPKFRYKKNLKRIVEEYKKTLQRFKLDIPKEVK